MANLLTEFLENKSTPAIVGFEDLLNLIEPQDKSREDND